MSSMLPGGLIIEDDEPLDLLPGGHGILLTLNPQGGRGLRKRGLSIRDTILVLEPGGSRFAFLFRQPLGEPTVALNALRYGTGGLHIDACRVRCPPRPPRPPLVRKSALEGDSKTGAALGMFRPGATFVPGNHPGGRWPPNLVLVHAKECRELGARPVQTHKGRPTERTTSQVGFSGGFKKLDGKPIGYADQDGVEIIARWECQPGCPVMALDEQSGILKSGDPGGALRKRGDAFLEGHTNNFPLTGFGDTGGASRFFPQFRDEPELRAWLKTLIGATQVC